MTLTFGDSTSPTMSGAIRDGAVGSGSGSLSLIKQGTGTVLLGGNDTYSGTTTLNAGGLGAGSAVAFGANSAWTMASGTTLSLNGFSNTIGSLSGAGTVNNNGANAATLTMGGNGSTTTFTGSIANGSAGALAVLKTGAGAFVNNAAATYSGGLTISQGSYQTSSTTGAGSGTVTLNDANTGANNTSFLISFSAANIANPFVVANAGTGTTTVGSNAGTSVDIFTGNFQVNKPLTLQGVNTDRTTYQGTFSGNVGTLTINGGARTTMEATNTYLGNVVLAGSGTKLQIGTSAASSNVIPDTASVDVGAGATFFLNTQAESINALTDNGTVALNGVSLSTLTIGAGDGSGTFSGTMSGLISIVKTGVGTEAFASPLTYTGAGGTVINNGTLLVTNTTGSGTSTGSATVNPGAVLGGTGIITGAVTVNGGRVSPNTDSATGTLTTGPLTFATTDDNYNVQVTGTVAGSLYDQLSAASTSAANIALGSGNVVLNFSMGYVASPGDAYTIINNTTTGTTTGTFAGLPNNSTFFSGGQAFNINYGSGTGNDVVITRIANPTILYVSPAWVANNPGDVIADADPVKAGSQTATIGATAFATVGGALAFANGPSGNPSDLIVVNGGAYNEDVLVTYAANLLVQQNASFNSLGDTVNTANLILDNGATLTVGSDNLSASFSSNISGTGGLTKTGTGTFTLTGSNSYTGATTINAGVLQSPSSAGLSSVSPFVVNSGGTLGLDGANATLSSLVGSGVVQNGGFGASTLTLLVTAPSTFAGTLEDGPFTNLSLVKAGPGVLTLTGTDSFTGMTTVSAGTLILAGNAPNANSYNVSASAVLQFGNGTTAPTVNSNTSINDSGSVVFDRPDVSTYAGNINGGGSVTQAGAGTTVLTSF